MAFLFNLASVLPFKVRSIKLFKAAVSGFAFANKYSNNFTAGSKFSFNPLKVTYTCSLLADTLKSQANLKNSLLICSLVILSVPKYCNKLMANGSFKSLNLPMSNT